MKRKLVRRFLWMGVINRFRSTKFICILWFYFIFWMDGIFTFINKLCTTQSQKTLLVSTIVNFLRRIFYHDVIYWWSIDIFIRINLGGRWVCCVVVCHINIWNTAFLKNLSKSIAYIHYVTRINNVTTHKSSPAQSKFRKITSLCWLIRIVIFSILSSCVIS